MNHLPLDRDSMPPCHLYWVLHPHQTLAYGPEQVTGMPQLSHQKRPTPAITINTHCVDGHKY